MVPLAIGEIGSKIAYFLHSAQCAPLRTKWAGVGVSVQKMRRPLDPLTTKGEQQFCQGDHNAARVTQMTKLRHLERAEVVARLNRIARVVVVFSPRAQVLKSYTARRVPSLAQMLKCLKLPAADPRSRGGVVVCRTEVNRPGGVLLHALIASQAGGPEGRAQLAPPVSRSNAASVASRHPVRSFVPCSARAVGSNDGHGMREGG